MVTHSLFQNKRVIVSSLAIGLFLCMLLLPSVQAIAWLNLAQISHMKGHTHDAQQLLTYALERDPSSVLIRWHVGSAFERMNNHTIASDVLLPLVYLGSPNPVMADSILAALLNSNHSQEALHFYETLHGNDIPLSSNVAAHLLLAYLRAVEQTKLSYEQEIHLLVQALASKTEAKISPMLQEQIHHKDFWSTTLGMKLKETLIWRGRLVHQEVRKESPIILNTQTIGTMLDIPQDTISFGTELVDHGTFDQYYDIDGIPRGWETWFRVGYLVPKVSDGIFILGLDSTLSFEGPRSLRIDGLAIERKHGQEESRVGILQRLSSTIQANQIYVLTFTYRSTGIGGDVYIPGLLHQNLPSTEEKWKRGTIIFLAKTSQTSSLFLLRLLREGSIWFDSVSMRPLILDTVVSISPIEVNFHLEDV